MPFTKVGKDDYTSPSGRHFNGAQVRLWHARGGKFPGEKGPGEMSYSKGGDVRTAHYASGGAVLGRTTNFMKTPDEFRTDRSNATDETWGKGEKGSDLSKRTGNKSLPAVKPKK